VTLLRRIYCLYTFLPDVLSWRKSSARHLVTQTKVEVAKYFKKEIAEMLLCAWYSRNS